MQYCKAYTCQVMTGELRTSVHGWTDTFFSRFGEWSFFHVYRISRLILVQSSGQLFLPLWCNKITSWIKFPLSLKKLPIKYKSHCPVYIIDFLQWIQRKMVKTAIFTSFPDKWRMKKSYFLNKSSQPINHFCLKDTRKWKSRDCDVIFTRFLQCNSYLKSSVRLVPFKNCY